jgi:ribosomal protein S27E
VLIGHGLALRAARPEETSLYPLIEANLDAFLEHLRERDAPLPRFVVDEFREYLRCGRLEHGFVRVKCDGCRHEHLVAFSCKCRGFCPSCGARRMVETSAHLIDHVLPAVPVRQWVLSFPWPIRFLLSTRPEAVTRVLAIVVRAIESSLIRRAGLTRKGGASGGVVTLIQRFGGAVNLNLHLHMVALDGVYTKDDETPRFHEVSAPSSAELHRLLDAIVSRVLRCLEHDGLLIRDPEQPWLDLASRDALDTLGAASIQYRIAVGPHAGRKALTLKLAAPKSPSTVPKPFTVARDGFSLNAAVAFAAHEREGIERLCRYVTRPALALERLSTNEVGHVVYQLKAPHHDGTTHFVFEPLDFLARLAALVPRPRGNLVRYHGTVTTVRPEREASKQGCPSYIGPQASQRRTGPGAGAGQRSP